MAFPRPLRDAGATRLSRSILVVALSLVGATARAGSEGASPPASQAPPKAPPAIPAPTPPEPTGFVSRHHLGAQLGGTGIAQVVYRYRALGPIHLEVGAGGMTHAADFSVGLLVGFPVAERWFPYAGLGVGALVQFGPKPAEDCDPAYPSCVRAEQGDTVNFAHARIGVGVALDAARRQLLSLDFGGWRGTYYASRTDAFGTRTVTSSHFLLPMAGLSYFLTL